MSWLRVESQLPAQLVFKHQERDTTINSGNQLQNHASLFTIPAYTEIVRKHEVVCIHRGCYRISSFTLSYGDILGIKSKTVAQDVIQEIVVFPKIIELRDFPLSVRQFMQSIHSMNSPLRENHYNVSGVRPYQGGDSMRMINWSATAKTGELLVHKRESMCNNDLILLINSELLDQAHNRRLMPEQFEQVLSYAASASQYMISNGGKIGLVFNGQVAGRTESLFRLPIKGGTSHLQAIWQAMARFEPVTRLGLTYVLEQFIAEQARSNNYLLLTGFIDPQQEALIGQLRRMGNTVETMLLYKEVAS